MQVTEVKLSTELFWITLFLFTVSIYRCCNLLHIFHFVCYSNIFQAGWRENPTVFLEELKSLQATSLSSLGPALKESFNLLNLHRLQSGIDNYGMVRAFLFFCFLY